MGFGEPGGFGPNSSSSGAEEGVMAHVETGH
jgi:hypothetical protein